MKNPDSPSANPPMRSVDYWETLFGEEDPWKYSTSAYERWKSGLTLGLLPAGKRRFALEVGCAEGHMSAQLAPRVERLLAVDMSTRALARARKRCASFHHVDFQQLDIVDGRLPKQIDLILVSEVLFYLSRDEVAQVAKRCAEHLKVGGHILLVHGNLVQDDPTRTGFDWGHEFGALTIGRIFAATTGLALIKELKTPLFSIQLFRRGRTPKSLPPVQRVEVPLPVDLELDSELERTILWDGAVMTRGEAQRTETTTSVPILMYHAIGEDGPPELAPYRTPVAEFRRQLRYLRRHGYHSISLHEWVSSISAGRPVPGRPVIITFDDGYKDFFESALPALERSDFTATVFVVTDKVGHCADWDALTGPPQRLMDWDEVRQASARRITIGSHSATHKNFYRIPLEQIRQEGERARRILYEKLGQDVDLIAFPWGSITPEGRRVLAECGYRIGLRSYGGRSTLTDDPLELSRIEINGTDDLDVFIRKLAGTYAPSQQAGEQMTADASEASEPVAFLDPEFQEQELVSFSVSTREARTSIATETELVEFAPTASFALPGPPGPRVSAAPLASVEEPATAAHPASDALRRQDFSLRTDYRQQLASRLDALVGEFVKLQVQLLNDGPAPMTVQKRLVNLFALPVTGRVARTVQPGQQIIERVAVSFESSANLILLVEPKTDHSLSPDSYLNTLKFELSGHTEWFSLNVALDWRELSLAERFQLSLYANCNRPVTCEAGLRLPRVGDPVNAEVFATFTLSSTSRNAVMSGELSLPDFITLDTKETPELVFFFDTSDDLSLELNYINCYFA